MPDERSYETKNYRVSLSDGSESHEVSVPLRRPFTKKLRRHFEEVRETADGRKKIEMVPRQIEHTMDVESEMRDDAVREWNAKTNKTIAARNLRIEELSTEPLSSQSRRPAKSLAASASE